MPFKPTHAYDHTGYVSHTYSHPLPLPLPLALSLQPVTLHAGYAKVTATDAIKNSGACSAPKIAPAPTVTGATGGIKAAAAPGKARAEGASQWGASTAASVLSLSGML